MNTIPVLFSVSLACIASITCPAAESTTPPAQPARPNIIVILADDLGYHDLGVQGGRDIPTPHIDSLAHEGVRFTNGYVSGPVCSPTRAALLTGRYQQHVNCEGLTGWPGCPGLPTSEATIADRLRAAGYTTGIIGKWHLGREPRYHPLNRGFDEFFGFLAGGHTYFPNVKMSDAEVAAGYTEPIIRNRKAVGEKDYLTTACGREAAAFIRNHRDKPFFLYLAFNAVHTPLQAPERYLEEFPDLSGKRRLCAAMMAAVDDEVGRVLGAVKDSGLEERTLVFFLSDNGAPVTHNAPNGSSNHPLRGQKGETWEGGVRVPFIAKWKGTLPAGIAFSQPVIQLDITATALAVAGVQPQPEWKLDGVDLLPHLRGENRAAPHAALYWRFGHLMAVTDGEWKLVTPYLTKQSQRPPPAGYDWLAQARLFRIGKDIGEQTDVTGQFPGKAKELAALWSRWNASLPSPSPARLESK